MLDFLFRGATLGSGVAWLVAFSMVHEQLAAENSVIVALEIVFFIILSLTALASLIHKVVTLLHGSANKTDVKTKNKTST